MTCPSRLFWNRWNRFATFHWLAMLGAETCLLLASKCKLDWWSDHGLSIADRPSIQIQNWSVHQYALQPAIESGSAQTKPWQYPLNWQAGLFNKPDDLKFLGRWIFHIPSSHPRSCFFWAGGFPLAIPPRFPSVNEPQHADSWLHSRSLYEQYLLPVGSNSFQKFLRSAVIDIRIDTFSSTKLGNTFFASKAFQHGAYLLFGWIITTGCSANISYYFLNTAELIVLFCHHRSSFVRVTMNQNFLLGNQATLSNFRWRDTISLKWGNSNIMNLSLLMKCLSESVNRS